MEVLTQKDPIRQNLEDRAELMKKCLADEKARVYAYELFNRDIFKFFELALWTYDPRKSPPDRPFIPFPIQRKLIKQIQEHIDFGQDLLIDKCRDMGVTWTILGVFVYRFLFRGETFLLGSRKEELVDTLGDMDTHFERIRYIIKNIPEWLLALCGYDRKNSGYMKVWKENGAQIVGESMNPNFSRQGRYKAILLDEFAFVEKAELIWRATGDSAPCRIPVSTPNGKHNYFAKLRFQQVAKIDVFSLDWWMHPEKDENWYAQQKEKRPSKDLAQEVDRNYTVSAGEPFYSGFTRSLHVRKITPNPHKPIITSWDYGFQHPNCTLHQIDDQGRWIIIDNIFGTEMIIDEFADMVIAYLNANYSGFDYFSIGYGDPAGKQKNDKSKLSSEQLLKAKGFAVQSVASNTAFTNYTARKSIIEKKLHTIINGMPALVIRDTPNNEIIIEGFEGGYRYPDENKYGKMVEKPVDDGYYEHPMNCVEYFAINVFRPLPDKRPGERQINKARYEMAKSRLQNGGFGF